MTAVLAAGMTSSPGDHDEWDNDQLRALKSVKGKHFVVVDTSRLARP